jgi:uncharacterized membrane protein YdbT with pleckstrin-like domain
MAGEVPDIGDPLETALFAGQLPDESVYIFERRYWFVLLRWIWAPLALMLAPGLVAVGLALVDASTGRPLLGGIGTLIWIVCLFPGSAWTLWRILDWHNDRFIVTDRRIVHIDEIPLFRMRRDEAPLHQIQDVAVYMQGLWENLLYFGSVVTHTAGTPGTVQFIGIRKPRKVQAIIQALVRDRRRREAMPSQDEHVRQIREVLGLPQQRDELMAPEPQIPQWESEKARREQLGLVLRRLFLAEPRFGEHQTIWHKHWWALVKALVGPALGFAAVVAFWLILAIIVQAYMFWVDLIAGLMLSAVLLWSIWQTLDWWNDLYVITDYLIVDIEKIPLFSEERREARLDRIQDVQYDQPGIIYRLLDFGHVRLQTAAEIGRFTFDYVPHPQRVQAEVFQRLTRFRQRAQAHERQADQEAFLDILGLYHQRTKE